MLANSSPERLKRVPEQYAYKLLESKIVDKIEKYTFPISNEFLAHEYLISFIDSFSSYLGFDEKRKEYDLKVQNPVILTT